MNKASFKLKSTSLLAAIGLLLSSAVFAKSAADYQLPAATPVSVINMLNQADEQYGINTVSYIEDAGLYQVSTVNRKVFYFTGTGKYLIYGELVNLESKENLTESLRKQISVLDYDSLPFVDGFSDVAKPKEGEKSYRVAVFTDVDCPFCKRMESYLQHHEENLTIDYFLYPIESLHPGARETSEKVMCSSNPVKALRTHMNGGHMGNIEVTQECKEKVARTMAFGKEHGFTGTPTLIFANGAVLPGAPKSLADFMAIVKDQK